MKYSISTAAIVVAIMGQLIAGPSGLAAEVQNQKQTPSLWVVGSTHTAKLDHRLAGRMREAGFNINALGYPNLDGPALKWEDVSRYNVLVVHGLGKANADQSLSERDRTNLDILNRFMNEGGGILFVPVWGQQNAMIPPQKAFLEPLGLTPLFDEVVADPENSVKATAFDMAFARTANLLDTPVTAGAKHLWYPADARRIGGQTHTTPFQADAQWTVAVRGEKSSMTLAAPLDGLYTPNEGKPGSIASEVPLVAFRQVGKGRIVCLGIAGNYWLGSSAWAALEGVVLDKGLRKTPSDGEKILLNALRWLAEPSLAESVLGGAPMDQALLEDPIRTKHCKPFEWNNKVGRIEAPPARPGVIGARSRYSSGSGTVAEWVAAAKKAGLDYLVFLEAFGELSREDFDALKRDCAALTDAEFAAIPGFTIDDEIGNHYFYFGADFLYPPADFLSADGKVFISRDTSLVPGQPHVKGQLSMTTLDYAYTLGGFKLTAGHYLFGQDAAPFANFFCNFDAVGVVTAVDGQVVEKALDDYLAIADFGQGPLPVALNLMSAPEQIGRSGWRTVVRMEPAGVPSRVVGGTVEGSNKIAAYWAKWHFYPDNPTRIYVTEGPRIDNWSFVGPRDYEGANRGDFVWQNLRWRVYGQASSDVGLKSVQVFDGVEPFRHFRLAGEKEYAFALELNHDKQHNLVLVVEDMAGRKAISGEQWDRNHRLEEFNCADRNNQLTYGYTIDSSGRYIGTGGNGSVASPNKRVVGTENAPAFVFRNDPRLGKAAFDGGVGGAPTFFATPVLAAKERGAVQAPNVVESFRKLHTGDVNIGEGRWEHYFADNIRVANVWHTLWRTVPAEDFAVTHRRHFFQIEPDSPLAVFLERTTITLKRDVPNDGAEIGSFRNDNANTWVLRSSDGSVFSGDWELEPRSSRRELKVPFAPGAYAGLLDSGLGGAVLLPLTDNLEATLALPEKRNSNLRFRVPAGTFPQKAGESVEISYLLLGTPVTAEITQGFPEKSNEPIEHFRRAYGLDGGKPAYELELTAGQVISQRYLLEVDGRQAACMEGTFGGKLVSTLPVRVSGLDDRWSAFLHDGELGLSRPVGVFEGAAWATLPMRGPSRRIFIGHPVTVDVPGIVIQLARTGEAEWTAEFHNPGEAAVELKPSLNPRFPPFANRKLSVASLPIQAGQSVWLKIEWPEANQEERR